jgi:uncharacterized protein (TIGR00730 family)
MDFPRLELNNCPTVAIQGEELLKPERAHQNRSWLASKGAKPVRILSELIETEERLAAANITSTILFFGSARSKFSASHTSMSSRVDLSEEEKLSLQKTKWMTTVMDDVCLLAKVLTEWSMSRAVENGFVPYTVATGGGPGMMEAANKGAALVENSISIGMGITLPFETGVNIYCTPELSFEFQYFFTRKYCMVYNCRAFIATPGGYGTLDELFEVLTLLQNGKIEHGDTLPVVLFGKKFWTEVINWQMMEELGVISKSDIDRLFITDNVDDAFKYVTEKLILYERIKNEATLAKLISAKESYARASEQFRDHTRKLHEIQASKTENQT